MCSSLGTGDTLREVMLAQRLSLIIEISTLLFGKSNKMCDVHYETFVDCDQIHACKCLK